MALFRLPSSGPAALAPRGNGLLLRAPQMSDFLQWAHLRESSRDYLTPWEPIWPSDDLTRSGFRRRLRRYSEAIAADRSYPFLIFRELDGAMVGAACPAAGACERAWCVGVARSGLAGGGPVTDRPFQEPVRRQVRRASPA